MYFAIHTVFDVLLSFSKGKCTHIATFSILSNFITCNGTKTSNWSSFVDVVCMSLTVAIYSVDFVVTLKRVNMYLATLISEIEFRYTQCRD